MSALTVTGLCKSFGGLHVTTDVNLNVEPGERRLIIGPNGAGKTTLFNLITGELTPDCRLDPAVRPGHHRRAEPPPRPPRHGAHLPDHHSVRARYDHSQRNAGAARPVTGTLESADRSQTARSLCRTRAGGAGTGRAWPHRQPAAVADLLWRATARRDRHGAGAESESAAARRAICRAVDRRAARRATSCCWQFRATSPS